MSLPHDSDVLVQGPHLEQHCPRIWDPLLKIEFSQWAEKLCSAPKEKPDYSGSVPHSPLSYTRTHSAAEGVCKSQGKTLDCLLSLLLKRTCKESFFTEREKIKMLSTFHTPIGHLYFFGKITRLFVHFLNWEFSLFFFCLFFIFILLLSCKGSLSILDINPLKICAACKYFLPLHRLPIDCWFFPLLYSSQCVLLSHCHIIHLKYIGFHLSITPQ